MGFWGFGDYVVDLRIDAGFTSGEILDMLRDEGVHFLGRLKSNARLDAGGTLFGTPHRQAAQRRLRVRRGVGTLSGRFVAASAACDLGGGRSARRENRSTRLEPRDYFFLVTDRWVDELPGAAALEHYRGRGTFEDRLGEFCAAVGPHLVADVRRK